MSVSVLKRRAIIGGFAALILPAPAVARGMYCSRHPDRCEERRERWAKMTDEQRVAENRRVSAFLEAAESKRQRELVTGLSAIGGLAMVIGGALWAAVAWPTKT